MHDLCKVQFLAEKKKKMKKEKKDKLEKSGAESSQGHAVSSSSAMAAGDMIQPEKSAPRIDTSK